MTGLLLITLSGLLTSCDAFRLGTSQRVPPLRPVQDDISAPPHFIRTKRSSVQELVRVQPNLVHDMGWPEIQEISRSQAEEERDNSSQPNPPVSSAPTRLDAARSPDVEEEMERMVHLAAPLDAERYGGQPEASDHETELFGGPGAGDASREASGFYGTDMEDRDRGEEGGDDRDRRGGEDEWDTGEDRERRGGGTDGDDASESDHQTPDLDALIGYSPSSPSSPPQPIISSPAEVQDPGLQEQRASLVLEARPVSEGELWAAEGEEGVQSSGDGVLHSSIAMTTTTSAAAAAASPPSAATSAGGDAVVGTVAPETDTGTDFGLLGSFTEDETEREEGDEHDGAFTQNPTLPEVHEAPSREPLQPSVEKDEELEAGERAEMESEGTGSRHIVPLTTEPSPTISFTDPSWDQLPNTVPLQSERSEVRGARTSTEEMKEAQQVMCLDWKELVGRGYVILNMTQNMNCEEFRADQGARLLKILERVFARRMNSPEGSWELYLSKPTHQQHQLLMNVASAHGVIATSDVLAMLGEVRKSLAQIGIENYSAASRCQSQPSQTRSDYGKLFVVLVIIGSVCMVIITSGFIYICWQRRLPATKTKFRAEELHFVENGCHDNPMLDVTSDGQPEMQEKKKPSSNGLVAGGEGGREDSSRWQVFVNQAATEEEEEGEGEEEEQDTHL